MTSDSNFIPKQSERRRHYTWPSGTGLFRFLLKSGMTFSVSCQIIRYNGHRVNVGTLRQRKWTDAGFFFFNKSGIWMHSSSYHKPLSKRWPNIPLHITDKEAKKKKKKKKEKKEQKITILSPQPFQTEAFLQLFFSNRLGTSNIFHRSPPASRALCSDWSRLDPRPEPCPSTALDSIYC